MLRIDPSGQVWLLLTAPLVMGHKATNEKQHKSNICESMKTILHHKHTVDKKMMIEREMPSQGPKGLMKIRWPHSYLEQDVVYKHAARLNR